MNKITVKFLANKKHALRGKRLVSVTVDVNPRKGNEDAIICAAKLAQFRFGKVKLHSIGKAFVIA